MASSWILGMSTNAFLTYKDLRITPSHKHQILRDWGESETPPLTKRLAELPIVMHSKDYRACWYEGLGIDHEEWKKAKGIWEDNVVLTQERQPQFQLPFAAPW
jgi:hypothetical protein